MPPDVMAAIRQDKLKELEMNARRPTSDDSPHMKQIRILENRLDKVGVHMGHTPRCRLSLARLF